MAAVDVDVVESALRDVNLSSGRETVLKPEQESGVRALLAFPFPFLSPPSPSPFCACHAGYQLLSLNRYGT